MPRILLLLGAVALLVAPGCGRQNSAATVGAGDRAPAPVAEPATERVAAPEAPAAADGDGWAELPRPETSAPETQADLLQFIGQDCAAAVLVRPRALLHSKLIDKLLTNRALRRHVLGDSLPVESIEQLLVLAPRPSATGDSPAADGSPTTDSSTVDNESLSFIIRFAEPTMQPESLGDGSRQGAHRGRAYLVDSDGMALLNYDDRTLLVATEAALRGMLDAAAAPLDRSEPVVATHLRQASRQGQVSGVVMPACFDLKKTGMGKLHQLVPWFGQLDLLAPQQVDHLQFCLDLLEAPLLRLSVQARQSEDAQQIGDALQVRLESMQRSFHEYRTQRAEDEELAPLLAVFDQLLEASRVERQGQNVQLQVTQPQQMHEIAGVLGQWLSPAEEATAPTPLLSEALPFSPQLLDRRPAPADEAGQPRRPRRANAVGKRPPRPRNYQPQRSWTSANGESVIDAEMIDYKDGQVVLEDASGKRVVVPAEALSDDDRDSILMGQ